MQGESDVCRAGGRGGFLCAGMTFPLHSSVFRRVEAGFACSSLCLHIAGARHRVIYLFDYCPASWHVPLIDGHCVPAAAGLLVTPAQNSLKDSSAGTLVTLFHFPCPPSLYHSFSFPLAAFYQFPSSLRLLLNTHISPALSIFLSSLHPPSPLPPPPVVDLPMQIWQVTFAGLISISGVFSGVCWCVHRA